MLELNSVIDKSFALIRVSSQSNIQPLDIGDVVVKSEDMKYRFETLKATILRGDKDDLVRVEFDPNTEQPYNKILVSLSKSASAEIELPVHIETIEATLKIVNHSLNL